MAGDVFCVRGQRTILTDKYPIKCNRIGGVLGGVFASSVVDRVYPRTVVSVS